MSCECPLAGYCKRHGINKTTHLWNNCRNGKYFDSWERGVGPGQSFQSDETKKEQLKKQQDFRDKALSDLQTWLETSTDTAKTIEAWQAVFIRCGRCLVEWKAWVEQNPVTEPVSDWVKLATAEIIEKRWV